MNASCLVTILCRCFCLSSVEILLILVEVDKIHARLFSTSLFCQCPANSRVGSCDKNRCISTVYIGVYAYFGFYGAPNKKHGPVMTIQKCQHDLNSTANRTTLGSLSDVTSRPTSDIMYV